MFVERDPEKKKAMEKERHLVGLLVTSEKERRQAVVNEENARKRRPTRAELDGAYARKRGAEIAQEVSLDEPCSPLSAGP